MSAALELEELAPVVRLVVLRPPVTRGECAASVRPFPWSTCPYHLPGGETCTLDVADRGGATLEEVAELDPVALEDGRDRW
jgi:hypothetical protein